MKTGVPPVFGSVEEVFRAYFPDVEIGDDEAAFCQWLPASGIADQLLRELDQASRREQACGPKK